jgi:hypothetical protein
MRALVVYESMFGNTRRVAEAIADGLHEGCHVSVTPVGELDRNALHDVDLLVVGAPTHMHGLSRPASREAAGDQAAKSHGTLTFEPGAGGAGIRECLETLGVLGCSATAFDTRLAGPAFATGRASRKIARRLSGCGATLIAAPESFLVDKHNMLKPGELIRARAWGAQLAVTELRAERARHAGVR